MADVLDDFPTKRGNCTRFLDGRVYRVVNGVDIDAPTLDAARNSFYMAAARRGKKVRIHIESKDPLTLIVQALPKV